MLRNNLYKALKINTPPGFRTTRFIAWMKVYTSYLFMILEDLYQFYEAKDKEAKMTPQIAYLEHYLNERYATGTAIYIGDGYSLGPWVYYDAVPQGEEDFWMIEPYNYCYPGSTSITIGFVVNVPRALINETQKIAAIVQHFKLAGKTFIIQLY